jgi:predicted transcriptional regulator
MHSTKIKELRISQGLSRKQLAEISGVHWRTVDEVEKGSDSTNSVITKLYKSLGFELKPIKEKMKKFNNRRSIFLFKFIINFKDIFITI